MREAWHMNEEKLYIIPQNLPAVEIDNHKQTAKRDIYLPILQSAIICKKRSDFRKFLFTFAGGEL